MECGVFIEHRIMMISEGKSNENRGKLSEVEDEKLVDQCEIHSKVPCQQILQLSPANMLRDLVLRKFFPPSRATSSS